MIKGTNIEPKNTNRVTKFMEQYLSYTLFTILLNITTWLLARDIRFLIKWWFVISMIFLLIVRTFEFIGKKYYHFLIDMCYYINVVAILLIATDNDIRIVYPFLHGPLLFFSIYNGDAFIPHNLSKTITFIIHTFATVVSRRLYFNNACLPEITFGSQYTFEQFDKSICKEYYMSITFDLLKFYFFQSVVVYLIWFIPYACYVMMYKGKSYTLIRYVFQIKHDEPISTFVKMQYLLAHVSYVLLALCIGILAMQIPTLDHILVITQIVCGFLQGSYFYYAGEKFSLIKLLFKKTKTP